MIRQGVIAAVAALALGSVGMATDASAAPRNHGPSGPSVQASGGSMQMNRLSTGSNVRANTSVRTGYASSGRNFTRTSWNSGGSWEGRRHHRGYGGWGWGPSVGIGFGYADYDYGWGPGYGYGYGYDYAPSVAYAGYGGGCGCGYPGGYAYGYGPAYAYAPVGIGIGFGFGGWGGGWHHHHHW